MLTAAGNWRNSIYVNNNIPEFVDVHNARTGIRNKNLVNYM